MRERALISAIAELVPVGSRVLDLSCGDGSLLSLLQASRQCSGCGVRSADIDVQACLQRGVNVIQLNLEEGLSIFGDLSFDVVLQINTSQHLHNTEVMLRETVRVGHIGIIAFSNFAHWPNRLSMFKGRLPATNRLPFQWYDTPNIRVCTYADFAELAAKNQLTINDSFGLQEGRVVRWLPNIRGDTAVFKLSRCPPTDI